jgi:hypothetical protein
MPDEHSLTSRQADQPRTDIANVECGIEAKLPETIQLLHDFMEARNSTKSC